MALFVVAMAFTRVEKKPLAAEPIMGVTMQSAFGIRCDENDVYKSADYLEWTGLLDAGYKYLILDDGMVMPGRDKAGNLVIDSYRFPSDLTKVIDNLHERGILFGLSAAAGTATCDGGAGSIGNETKDAYQFAAWGVDLLKYDFCNNPIQNAFYAPPIDQLTVGSSTYYPAYAELRGGAYVYDGWILGIGQGGEAIFPVTSDMWEQSRYVEPRYLQDADYGVVVVDINGEEFPLITTRTLPNEHYSHTGFNYTVHPYTEYLFTLKNDYNYEDLTRISFYLMADALAKQKRDIVFIVNDWGQNKPFLWAPKFAHMWRNTLERSSGQNECTWDSIQRNYDANFELFGYSGESAHNDADFLCIGMNGISDTEAEAQLSLWAMIDSPLIIGANVAKLLDQHIKMLTNKYVIRVNQDKTHIQAIPVERDTDYDILLKPLDDGFAALLYFNKNDKQIDIAFDLSQMGNWFDFPAFVGAEKYHVLDAWTGAETDISAGNPMLSQRVDGHSVAFFIVTNYA